MPKWPVHRPIRKSARARASPTAIGFPPGRAAWRLATSTAPVKSVSTASLAGLGIRGAAPIRATSATRSSPNFPSAALSNRDVHRAALPTAGAGPDVEIAMSPPRAFRTPAVREIGPSTGCDLRGNPGPSEHIAQHRLVPSPPATTAPPRPRFGGP